MESHVIGAAKIRTQLVKIQCNDKDKWYDPCCQSIFEEMFGPRRSELQRYYAEAFRSVLLELPLIKSPFSIRCEKFHQHVEVHNTSHKAVGESECSEYYLYR